MKSLNLTIAALVLCTFTTNSLWSQLLSMDPINFPDYVKSIPFVDDNDNVYVITGRTLYSIRPQGTENWKYYYDSESIYPESLCATSEGNILFATYDERVHCFDTNGDSIWSYKMRDLSKRYRDGCHIVYSENDKILVASADSFLYVLNSSGILEWDKKFEQPFANAVASFKDSIIYCTPYRDTVFYAFDFNGNSLWENHPGGERVVKQTPVVNSKGEVCMYSENGYSGVVKVLDMKGDVVFEKYNDLISDPYYDNHDNLYFAEHDWFTYVRCLDDSGNEKWWFNPWTYVYSSPRVGPDGNLYFGGDNGNVYCLDTIDGTEIYRFKFTTEIRYPVDFTSDGTIFCLVGHPRMFSVSGVLRSISNPQPPIWMAEHNEYTKSPAISNEGIIVVCSMDSVHAFNETGQEIWTYDNEGDTLEAPVIIDNTVVVASRNNLTSLNLDDGSLKWRKQANGQFYDAPGIGVNKSIYIGSTDKSLYAYTAEGDIKWSYVAEDTIFHSPAVTSLGNVVFSCQSGWLYSLDSLGNLKFKTELLAYNDSVPYISSHSPTIDGYGNIYIGTKRNEEKRAALMSYNHAGNLNWARLYSSDNIDFKMYPPTFDKEDNLYFRFGRFLRSYDLAGNSRWLDEENNIPWEVELTGEGWIWNPTIDHSGNLYGGTNVGNIYKINSLCELEWVYNNADNEYLPSPVFIGESGKYYFTADRKLHHFVENTNASEVYSKNRSDNGNTNLFNTIDITGINNKSDDFNLQIYPNPASNYIVLSWSDQPNSLDLYLYNIQGKLLLNRQIFSDTPISMDGIPPGIYLVRLFSSKKFVHYSKIIVE